MIRATLVKSFSRIGAYNIITCSRIIWSGLHVVISLSVMKAKRELPAPRKKLQLVFVIIFYNVKYQMTPRTTWMTSSWPIPDGLEGLIV